MELQQAMGFVADRTKGVLITTKSDGRPQASNIGYATWDGAVHISVTDDRAKTKNLVRDPRGSLHVTSQDFWSWAVIEGTAEVAPVTTDAADDTAALLRRVYESIAGPHPDWDEFNEAMIAEGRTVISLHAERAYGQLPSR